jgi:hypothetical protein
VIRAASGPSSAGFVVDPFTAAEIERFSTVSAGLRQPPAFLVPIYKAAGRKYDIPWQILAAINAVETNYGQDLAVSPMGAFGWMQFHARHLDPVRGGCERLRASQSV